MNEWVEVINLLCEKLGIAVDSASLVAEKLVPQLVKMELASYAVGTVIAIAVSALAIIGIVKIVRFTKSEDYNWMEHEEFCVAGVIGLGILTDMALIFAWIYGFEMLEWAFAPDIKAIEYISNMVKGSS